MRYYVVSDPHGFCRELWEVIAEQGFFTDPEPHKLIICGDLLDRGQQALAMQDFLLELLRQELVILVRGNHEDLALELLENWDRESYRWGYHRNNYTVDTACQLARREERDLGWDARNIGKRFGNSLLVQKLIPATVDYYETEHYIFVHGWIPCGCQRLESGKQLYTYRQDWRSADPEAWVDARWHNGMDAAAQGVIEPGKTIVCGHIRCAYGHAVYENREEDFSPYRAPGILALDACTALTGRVNCVVIED